MFLAFAAAAPAENGRNNGTSSPAAAAEDISGTYRFIKEGEFVQINLETNGVSGYISREGDLESDRGLALDQFFARASVQGHDVFFVTRPVHGVWFEFKGRFERGGPPNRWDEAYFILRGKLTESRNDEMGKTTTHLREVEFRSVGEPLR